MSAASDLVDAVVREKLAGLLKRENFRKYGRTFLRETRVLSHIVNIQSSQWNFEDQARFTMNLGVYVPTIAARRGIVARGARPNEADSTVRRRIGALMPEKLDHWWLVTGASNISAIAEEVANAYASFGAPWLDSLRTIEAVFESLRENDELLAASAALELGRTVEAERLVKKALQRANSYFEPTVRRFAQRNGLQLEPPAN